MPKKAFFIPSFPRRCSQTKVPYNERPCRSKKMGLALENQLRLDYQDSALALGIHYQYAKKILKTYNELGGDGLKNKKIPIVRLINEEKHHY
ncbi:MAG: hypothetical protein HC916_21760 [Coleofasciculaceae cyanobacterium SM2_1_6]|nr:hypothetical protein [Coleofasciculaceae cyanobacterium SM2_1_6]